LQQLRAHIVECRTRMGHHELKWHARMLCEEMLGVNRIGTVRSIGTNASGRGPEEVEVSAYVVHEGDGEKAQGFFESLAIDLGGRIAPAP
jgi:hypothetical protein